MKIILQFFGGRGGASGKKRQNKADTLSGVSYEQFFAMSDEDKADFVFNVINNPNIIVPDYLDDSVTSKVMYALGINNKPMVVSDSELDKLPGEDLYRTVYDTPDSPISSTEILDQIRHSDYTQLSGSGGSVYGRAIYFATDFERSAMFGIEETNPVMMRAKINPNAKIIEVHNLSNISTNSRFIQKLQTRIKGDYTKDFSNDWMSLTALANGIDGWKLNKNKYDYVMVLNRRALTVSSKSKKVDNEESWHKSKNAN